jgi:hypothetical protein
LENSSGKKEAKWRNGGIYLQKTHVPHCIGRVIESLDELPMDISQVDIIDLLFADAIVGGAQFGGIETNLSSAMSY